MNMKAGPPGEPVPDQRRLVGGVVAGNQVHVQLGGHLGLDSLARRANAWAVLGRRVHCSKVSRSAPSRAKSAIGLPPPIFIFPFAK